MCDTYSESFLKLYLCCAVLGKGSKFRIHKLPNVHKCYDTTSEKCMGVRWPVNVCDITDC